MFKFLIKFKGPPRPQKQQEKTSDSKESLLALKWRAVLGFFAFLGLTPLIFQIGNPLNLLMFLLSWVVIIIGLNPPSRKWLRLSLNFSIAVSLMSLCSTLTLGNPLQAAFVAFLISQLGINRTFKDVQRILLVTLLGSSSAFLFNPSTFMLVGSLVSIFGACLIHVWFLNANKTTQNHIKPSVLRLVLRSWVISIFSLIVLLMAVKPLFKYQFHDFNSAAKTGLTDQITPGSIKHLLANPTTAFRVIFNGTPPPPQDWYWRGPVLYHFDGQRWTMGSFAKTEKIIPKVIRGGLIYSYRWLNTTNNSLPTFLESVIPSSQIKLKPDYSPELTNPANSSNLIVNAQKIISWPPLSNEERKTALEVPPGNPKTYVLAQRLHTQFPNDGQFVFQALMYFQKNLKYTSNPPLLGKDSIDDFLFHTKEGFCVHLAGAMVILLRDAGIPARMVNGYQGGHWNNLGGYWQIRQSDAHAWVEAWLPDYFGWVRIDPTAMVMPLDMSRSSLSNENGFFSNLQDWSSYEMGEIGQIKVPDFKFSIPTLQLNTKTTFVLVGLSGVLILILLVQLKKDSNKTGKDSNKNNKALDRAICSLQKKLDKLRLHHFNHESWVKYGNRINPLLEIEQQLPFLDLIKEIDKALYGKPLSEGNLRKIIKKIYHFKPKPLNLKKKFNKD